MAARSPRKRRLKILMVFDLPYAHGGSDGDFLRYLRLKEWKDERHVYKALKDLGHDVVLYGVYDDVKALMQKIEDCAPDLVFPLCESVYNERSFATNIVSMLELLQVRFTGASSQALTICQDKAVSKSILQYHQILTPRFLVSYKTQPLRKIDALNYPVIVKPLELEASEGISQNSVVHSPEDALARCAYLHQKLSADVIFEEFIPGRELYVGVLGNQKVEVFPPREFVIETKLGDPMVLATYKAKWDEAYRRKMGIKNLKAYGLPSQTLKDVTTVCRKIYRIFQLRGYAQIDLRVTDDQKIYFLEANPNPAISKDDDFASGAKLAGLAYEDLIDQIVTLAAS